MTADVKALLEQAMQLSPDERAEVANALDGMSAISTPLDVHHIAVTFRDV
jgi:hypothetical protein